MHFVEKAGYQLIWLNGCRIILEGKLMREKEIAQRIIALYQSQSSDEDKKQFVALLKSIITMSGSRQCWEQQSYPPQPVMPKACWKTW